MKHRFLFIMALLLTAAASAWADEPKVYTSAVSVSSLKVGDILADGFSLTGDDGVEICLKLNRYKIGETIVPGNGYFDLGNSISISYGANGAITVTANSTTTFTPVDENRHDGNAWVVMAKSPLTIGGITYDSPIDLTYNATAGGWTYTQPAYDVELEMEYYDPATLASAPTAATSLEYSSEAQNLITAGTATGGTLYYGLGTADAAPTDASAWSETVPTGTTVGMYYVWYKVVGDATHGDIAPAGPLSVTIAKATPTISVVPTAGAITYGQTLEASTLAGGSATFNSQPVAGSFAWTTSTTAPSVSDSENTEYSVTFTPTDGTNYNSATTTVRLTVTPGSMTEGITVTPYNAAYDGSAHGITVVLSGVAEGATVKYRTAETGEYDLTDCPTYTGVGSYTTYYQVTKTNYTTVESSATVTITKATATISYATTEVSKAFGATAFTNTLSMDPATGTGLGTVTYAVTAETPGEGCTSEHVATINASTGVVTIIGAGSATITATVTDGTNYTYSGMEGYNTESKTASVNYTLTVNPISLEGATVTLSQESYGYDGTAKEPTVSSVVLNGNTLADTHYTVSYSNNINAALSTAGESAPTVTVTGIGNYSGTASQTFTINKATATISYATTTVSKAFGDAAFTNALNNTPAAGTDGTGLGTVAYTVTAETKDADCTSDHVATIDASTGEVTITGTGSATITATATDGDNYTYGGTNTATYTLTVAKGTITASATGGSYSYSASGSHAITVSVTKPSSGYTIKYGTTAGNYELSSNPSYSTIGSHTTYYKVSAPNYNDFTGQATVTINKASGSLSFASSSLTKTYGDDNFVNALNKTGDGAVTYSSTKPAVATVDASTGLVTIKGTGTTTISATMSATDAYSSDYATFSLTVNAASLTGATVALSQTSYDYDGTAKEPAVSAVILNGKVLTSSDYDVSYADNTNAGTATVTVTGKGNYTGTASQTFTITSVTTTDGNITVVDGGSETVLTINDMGNQQGKTVTPDLQVTTLNYYRSLNASDESVYTVCLPYAPKTDASLKYYTLTGCEGTTLKFDEITGAPQAYTPYLVSASKTTDIGTENLNQPITMSQTVVNSFSAGNYVMKGSLSGFTHDQSVGKYILQSSNRWGLVGSDTHAYIPPFRAYIEATVSGARMLDSSFYDEATGIYSLRTVDRDGTERYYDLNGRRIDDPKKTGIYIRNGRKEVLK